MTSRILLLLIAASFSAAAQTYTAAQASAISKSYALETSKDYAGAADAIGAGEFGDGDYFTQLRLGWLLYLQAKFAAAIERYERALQGEPNAVEARIGVMNCRFALKEYRKTAVAARELLAIDAGNYSAMLYRVLASESLRDYRAAETEVREALKLYPIDLSMNVQLGYIYVNQLRGDDARALVARLGAIYGSSNAEVAALAATIR